MRTLQILGRVKQFSDSAESSASQLGTLLATKDTVNSFGGLLLVFAIFFVVLLLGCTIWMARRNRMLKRRESSHHEDLHAKDQQIQLLQQKIDSFDNTRSGYLSLITNMSFVMRNVNLRQSMEDLVRNISSLVKSILHTDVVEFYTYNPEDDLLRRVDPKGKASKEQVALPLGKGLIGTAAKDRMILTTEHFNRIHLDEVGLPGAHRRLWMAAPIQFETQILGVIAIGKPKVANGAEKDLLGILAQMSGVVLYHQSFLIRARRNADTDVLTGLHNRRYFYRMSRRFVEESTQAHAPISLFLIDLDHFKHYNDTNGHDEGDRLLIELSGLLRGCAPEDAVVARYGGEEFIVMMPGVSTDDALGYAEYLRNAVASHPFPHRTKQPFGCISISGGIAGFPDHGRSIQEVIRLADSALYKAKESGRNRIVVHNSCLSVAEEEQLGPFDGAEENEPFFEEERKSA
jgi:diguanylate cyclase (GGDEF)-like protein